MLILTPVEAMQNVLGDERFERVLKSMEKFRSRGDRDVVAAFNSVASDVPASSVNRQALANLILQSDDLTFAQRAVDSLKLMLNQCGIPLSWFRAESAALRKVAKESWLAVVRREP